MGRARARTSTVKLGKRDFAVVFSEDGRPELHLPAGLADDYRSKGLTCLIRAVVVNADEAVRQACDEWLKNFAKKEGTV